MITRILTKNNDIFGKDSELCTMHIGIICDPRNFHTQKWATALQQAGVRVTIFSFWENPDLAVPQVCISPRFPRGGDVSYFSYLFTADRLRRALKKHGVTVVNPINVTPFGVWAARAGVQPIAMVSMGADILEYPPIFQQRGFAENRAWDSSVAASSNGFVSRLKTYARYLFFRHQVAAALQKSAFITGDNLVLTDAVRDWFGINPKKIHLNRWGVEPEMFAANDAQLAAIRQRFRLTAEQRVVLSPRGMKPIYQGDIIIDAFAALLRDGRAHTGHKYVMLGAGYPVPEAVMQQARALEKEYPNFIFIPEQLPREVVLHLWNFVDIFVNAPVYDGYSNALAEGRFVGAIPIVNDTPATRELIRHGENGLVVAPFTAPNLANTLAESLLYLDTYQPIFAHSNSDWIAENSLLSTNIRDFIACCEAVEARKDT